MAADGGVEEWKIGRVRMIALVGERCPRQGEDRGSVGPPEEGSPSRWCARRNPLKRASSASLPHHRRMSGRLRPDFAQIAPIGGIADQRLVALLQRRIERGDDRFTVLAVVLASVSLRRRHSERLRLDLLGPTSTVSRPSGSGGRCNASSRLGFIFAFGVLKMP